MAILTLWLLLFLILGALLGFNMYTILCLQDLESDLINPHDASSRVNQLALPEFALQAAATLALLGTQSWLMLLVHVPLAMFHLRLYGKNEHVVEVTDVFGRLAEERSRRTAKMAAYVVTFVFVIYRGTKTAVNSFMTEEGKAKAAEFFKDAVASNMHHF